MARRKKEQEEKRRLENEKELIKTDTDNVAHQKIESLREILDEVDQNVYENEQKMLKHRKEMNENTVTN